VIRALTRLIAVADVSVRPAVPDDADEIARIQVATWRTGYVEILPKQVLDSLDEPAVAQSWTNAVTDPPSRQYRVLVAIEGSWTVGFVAFGPDADAQPGDPDPEATTAIGALLVEPRWSRRGHASRLLAATADICRTSGIRRMVAWVPAKDTASLELYRDAGWQADGLQRSLDTGAGEVAELRLHASLSE
jgi:GNAT superfamily N-acetyltransferase